MLTSNSNRAGTFTNHTVSTIHNLRASTAGRNRSDA